MAKLGALVAATAALLVLTAPAARAQSAGVCTGTGAHDKHGEIGLSCQVCHPCGGKYEFSPTYTLPSGTPIAGGTITPSSGGTDASCSVACHNPGNVTPAPTVSWTDTGVPLACTGCHADKKTSGATLSTHYADSVDPVQNRSDCEGCHVTTNHLSQIVILGGDNQPIVVDPTSTESVNGACLSCHGGNGRPLMGLLPPLVAGYGAGGGDFHGARTGTGFGGTLAQPYSRGQSPLPCTACHDSHQAPNPYLFAETVNGGTVLPGYIQRTGSGAQALCENCHLGNRHAGCQTSGCHTFDPAAPPTDCFHCHTHNGIENFVLPSWENHPDYGKPPEFCAHCHTSGAPADTTPPTFTSNIAVNNITSTGATITWQTNEPATSIVEYGVGSPTTRAGTTNLTASHAVVLSGLTPGTTYVYRVRSADGSNNELVSDLASFSTPSTAALPAPIPTPLGYVETYTDPTPITFYWSQVTSPSGSPIHYVFQISTASNFSADVSEYTVNGTSLTLNLWLAPLGYYYWRVKAVDGVESPWGSDWLFLYSVY